jgi:hypothetical protein
MIDLDTWACGACDVRIALGDRKHQQWHDLILKHWNTAHADQVVRAEPPRRSAG